MKRLSVIIMISLLIMLCQGNQWAAESKVLRFEDGESLDEIRLKIQHNKYDFEVDYTWVYDMSPDQKKRFFSRRPSKHKGSLPLSDDMGPLAGHLGQRTLPTRFDWRNYNGHSYIGAVRDQGYCGSCYSFGACAAAEGTYNVAMGLKDGNCANFSESFIAWCLSRQSPYDQHFFGCEGADYDYFELKALVDVGIISESDFPYTDSDPGSCTHMNDGPKIKFKSWHRIPCGDVSAIKTAIMNYGVVDAAVMVDGAFEAYTGGIYQNSNTGCEANPCYYEDSNHAIALVGWDDSQGVFILRNSWGSSWGENGYMRIKYTSAGLACAATYMVYQDTPGSTLQVTSPNGGENWDAGSTHNITWSTTGSVGNVKIQYSTNNGSSWTTERASTTNDGSYSWSVPDVDSSQCKVRIKEASDGSPSDTSNAVFSIEESTPSATLTVTAPNGGESLEVGDSYTIRWNTTGTVGNVKIQYSTNNGSSWTTERASTANDGSYAWTVPDVESSQCKVRILEASDGSPSDTSNTVFSIEESAPSATLTVTSPNGGESYEAGDTQTIRWSTTGSVDTVKIRYSTNNGSSWTTERASTANDGAYTWTVPGVSSTQCLVKVSDSSGSPSDSSNAVFSIGSSSPPEITIARTQLNFTAVTSGSKTGSQDVMLGNSGGGTLNWSATDSASWLNCSPASGTGAGVLTVGIEPSGLSVGEYYGTVRISAPGASSTTVTVALTVKSASQDEAPMGEFVTPADGALVSSSVPVTGWVIDDVDVSSVRIFCDDSYVGDAVFVEGARPDIAGSFPRYPKNYQAGWGYMLLTHFLPGGGNGSYTLSAKAFDSAGNEVHLGYKNIYVDNDNADNPFGAIDTPAQGGSASGSYFTCSGWVLTPWPNRIPDNGSTINVYMDGVKMGTASYNHYRHDIAGLFTGYANSSGAGGWYNFDTTAYCNGVHSIYWVATDNAGNADGIGSRYFTILNTGAGYCSVPSSVNKFDRSKVVGDSKEPLLLVKGYKNRSPALPVYPAEDGLTTIEMEELERVEIRFNSKITAFRGSFGSSLPIGSTLDAQHGIFYWQAGLAFVGDYRIDFIDEKGLAHRVKISILPKYWMVEEKESKNEK